MKAKKRRQNDIHDQLVALHVSRSPVVASFGGVQSLDRLFVHCIRANISPSPGTRYLEAMVLPNEVCVLRLMAPLEVLKVTFEASLNCDRVSGKRKKTALILSPNDRVATLTLADGSCIDLLSPTKGRLLEMNQKLIASPSLLNTQCFSSGSLVILQIDPYVLRQTIDLAAVAAYESPTTEHSHGVLDSEKYHPET